MLAAGLALAVASGAGGCSFVFVDGPPPREVRRPDFQCTEGPGWPILDTVGFVFQTGRSIYALSRSPRDYEGATLSQQSDALIAGALAAVYATSLAVGYDRVRACNRAIAEQLELERAEDARTALPPPRRPAARRPPPVPPPPLDRAPPPPAEATPAAPPATAPAPAPAAAPKAPAVPQAFPD